MFGMIPGLMEKASFLQWSEQADDVYVIFDVCGEGIGVQIDPGLEYIIVWGPGGQAEYGDWGSDQVRPAVAHFSCLVRGELP